MNPTAIVLMIPTLIGLVCLKTDIRRVVPRLAIVLAALPFLGVLIWALGSSLSPELQEGAAEALRGSGVPVHAMPWFSLAFGSFTAAFILSVGYVYGDARRRGMSPILWALVAFMVPNLVGFLLYFLLRQPLSQACAGCGRAISSGLAFCPHCGLQQDRVASPPHAVA
ncbi:MAG TPA: hypothetical protein VGK45_02150 [Thermoanaerobaculia bacterium]